MSVQVNRVIMANSQSLPVYPDQRTSETGPARLKRAKPEIRRIFGSDNLANRYRGAEWISESGQFP
jgi:hypothetical protein